MVSTHVFLSTSHLLLIFFLSVLGTASYLQLIKPISCTKSPVFRCSEVEKEALLSFKDNLTDPSGRLSSSWVGEDCCNWKGVGCDNSTGNVVKLDLSNPFPVSEFDFYDNEEAQKAYNKSCLGGKISPSLLNLKHLSYLDLSLNNFNGYNVPRFLGSLESLRYLNLSFSTFAGVIPPHLGNLSRLQYLDLNSDLSSRYFYPDSFPSLEVESIKWLVGFPSLRYLNLGYVNLSKLPDWLDVINMLPSLVELHLQGCRLVNLPHSVSSINFTLLSFLDLSDNSFDSIIPHWLSNVSDLSIINLSSNQFTGDIPVGIGNLTNLRSLNLGRNNLIGKIPNSFANLCNLQTLDLQYNNISGEITEFVDGLSSNSSLEYLDLSFNRLLGGNLPYSMGGLKKLKNIDLSITSVGGSIPDSIGNLSSLQALDLSQTSVGGSIPDSIGNLSSLQALDLFQTSVGGSIPDSIGNLLSLQALDLSGTSVGGSIPDSIGNLSSLQVLHLFESSIGGSIPNSIGHLLSLQTLELFETSVGGSIPDSIGNLLSLQTLHLSITSVGGSIPDSIGNLSSLQTLDLSDNQMNGSIPESIGKLSMLVSLSLDSNSWKGVLTEAHFQNLTRLEQLSLSTKFSAKGALDLDVKHEWVPPFKLTSMRLANMRIGPNFPAWLKTQNELNDLELNNVGISDTIPHGLWKSCPNVTYWSLSGNNLSGQVPYFRFHPFAFTFDLSSNNLEGPLPLFRSNLSEIFLSNNMFHGPIPKNIGELLPKLSELDLSSNSITGKIPHSIGMLKELSILNLGNNSLFGKLPPHWKDLYQLFLLNLAENNISGNIPSSMRHLSSLEVLSLRQNHLEGELPTFFRNYNYLQSLDLGRNKFSGKLPTWIGESLPYLLRLSLRSNLFHGDIPQQLCLLSKLQILDLAHNDFSGAIPQCLGNFSHDENGAHYYDFQMLLVSKGREYLYDYSIIGLVHSIDLSGNSLSGEIPDNITTIDSKLVFLNLSMNHLIGRIPEKIGNLHMLESLDLSMNELSGPIPENLSSLTFLSHLNLSFNNLSGRIPSGNQLQTLNDSSIYEGNFLLCGLPLSTKCSDDETKPRGTPNGGNRVANKNGMEIESYSFYISMAAGFIIGFWGVCGTLIIIRSWRQAFFRSFDNLKDKIVVFIRVEFVRFLRKVKYS